MENSMAIGKRFLGYVNKQPMFIGETFLQNDITLLLSSFRTLSKWNVQWMALKSHSASFIWTDERVSGKVCVAYGLEIKFPVSGAKRSLVYMHYALWLW